METETETATATEIRKDGHIRDGDMERWGDGHCEIVTRIRTKDFCKEIQSTCRVQKYSQYAMCMHACTNEKNTESETEIVTNTERQRQRQ